MSPSLVASPSHAEPAISQPPRASRSTRAEETRAARAEETRAELLAAMPHLRAFAMSLVGSSDRADDLVQQTLLKALTKLAGFDPDTNLMAWLFTILRNQFYSDCRKRRREVEDVDGIHSGRLACAPSQEGRLAFDDFQTALAELPPEQREALILVGAEGMTYEQAGGICGAPTGTIKSRVFRARARLAQRLEIDAADAYGPDRAFLHALALAA